MILLIVSLCMGNLEMFPIASWGLTLSLVCKGELMSVMD